MSRPKHHDYDTAYEKLGEALKQAHEAYETGTIGTITDLLFDAIIALDDCFAHDGQECRFTKVRPLLEALKK